nr:uncharacterized protein LOC117974883 [Pan paniscus]
MPFCHIPDIIYPSNVHCFLTAKIRGWRKDTKKKKKKVSYLPFPGGAKNKNKENPPAGLFFPLKLQQLEEGKNDLGGGRGVVKGITRVWQVEAPNIHGTSSVAWPGGCTESSRLEPGGGGWGCPREDPKTPGSSGVQHRRDCLGKEVKVPPKRNKILDSSDHLLSPNSSSNIHPSLALAGCGSSTRLPWPRTRAGRGRGQGRTEGVAFATVARGASRRGGAGAVTTPRLPAPRLGPPTPRIWDRFQESLAVVPTGEEQILEKCPRWGRNRGFDGSAGVPRGLGSGELQWEVSVI